MSYGDLGVAPIPDPLPLTEQLKIGVDWTDANALRIVRSDFAYAEAYRTHSHDWRYRNASELYLAWAGQRYWEGTRVPRSSLGIYVAFEQVEGMLPKIVRAICDPDTYEFYADDPDFASLWKELIIDQLKEAQYREQIRLCAKSSLIYGNGILEWGMEDYEDESIEIQEAQSVKRMGQVYHPAVGMMNFPQELDFNYKRKIATETKRRPYVRYRSLIDSYVDPNCESTSLEKGGYFILRTYMRAEEIKALRGKKDFKIPDDRTLALYSAAKTTANQDVTKLSTELFRYNLWNPAQDYSGDPAQKRIEVIEYTRANRKVWMLNREWVAYNQPNKYRKINYYSMHYADVLDRWHALAMTDVAEGEQRLQQGIINSRVDELALSIHRPMVKRRGITLPAYQLKIRPGLVIETEQPDGDIKQLEVQDITQQAFIEVEASERRVQRATGMSDLAALGSPTSGGNSANRTAAGINTQVGATQDRASYYIQNAENLVVEPLLNTFIWLNKRFGDMRQAANWIKLHPQYKNKKPVEVMNAKVYAECWGAIRAQARGMFLQLFPQITQIIFNPELLQLMAQQQKKTISADVFQSMIFDALGYRPRNPLWIDMTPEQIQAQQQPPPEAKLKMMMQGQQIQADTEKHQDQNKTKLLNTLLQAIFGHMGKLSELDDKEV
ncbi:MAG TPA: hypothetical protein VF748_17475, partial [Candidatus Acidoferrum sp.]